MNISCIKCNKQYYIPDHLIDDRHVHFYCDKCNHKIVIIRKNKKRIKESWSLYRGLTDLRPTLKNILDGIFYSFNLKNILLSFVVLLSFSIVLSLFILIVYNNISFFIEHPFISGAILFILFVLLAYIYDIHLYLLSLNTFNRINTGISMKFSMAKYEIANDLKSIFILSIGIIIIFTFLFFPISLMDFRPGFIYEGIFHSVFVLLAIIIISIFYFKNIICAFIALKSRNVKYTFKNLFQFFVVENINIPIYIFFTNIISTIIAVTLFLLLIGVIVFISIILSASLAPETFFTSTFGNFSGLFANLSNFMGAGIVLVSISTYIVLLFIFSYIINLIQTLSTVSVYIMESNPGDSVSKNAILITILAVFIVLISSISSIISSIPLLLSR